MCLSVSILGESFFVVVLLCRGAFMTVVVLRGQFLPGFGYFVAKPSPRLTHLGSREIFSLSQDSDD